MSVVVSPSPLPALVVGRVVHIRHTPIRRRFAHRYYQWLVDLDDLPDPPWHTRWLFRFDPRDHLDSGRLGGGIRGDLTRFLASRGVGLAPEDRVLMLAHARVLGHTFDPLTIFWCLSPAGTVRAVVLEVHNTYGERHAYPLDLDASGSATVDKQFYVSPFNEDRGRYAIRLWLTPTRVAATVTLYQGDRRVLTATVSGRPRPATRAAIWATALSHFPMTLRVSLLIRVHGIALWAKRLRIHPRTPHPEEAVR